MMSDANTCATHETSNERTAVTRDVCPQDDFDVPCSDCLYKTGLTAAGERVTPVERGELDFSSGFDV